MWPLQYWMMNLSRSNCLTIKQDNYVMHEYLFWKQDACSARTNYNLPRTTRASRDL